MVGSGISAGRGRFSSLPGAVAGDDGSVDAMISPLRQQKEEGKDLLKKSRLENKGGGECEYWRSGGKKLKKTECRTGC
jgi:hypothetical protein